MDRAALETRLTSSIQTYDLLTHPFYQAWSAGELTRADLQSYAAQYQHQVDALPALLRCVRDGVKDPGAQAMIDRNLDEEEGRVGSKPHASLWQAFAQQLGAHPEAADPETSEAVRRLLKIAGEGGVAGLACLWAYEFQTARVAHTKREGLVDRYQVTAPQALEFFSMHQQLDVLHADELLSAIDHACGDDPEALEIASDAAARSAQAQWKFLDGAELRRSQRAAA